MKKHIILLFAVVAAFSAVSCTVQEGTLPGFDWYPHVVMTLSSPDPNVYDTDCDVAVRVAANDVTTEVYYFVEPTAVKKARNLAEAAYADFVVSNGTKVTVTPSEFDGALVADFVAQGLSGDNTLSAVAVDGADKYIVSKTFFGVKWNTIATGSYTFVKAAIASRAGGETIAATLQQRDDQPGTFRFKNLYGVGYSLEFYLLPDYEATDAYGHYIYARVDPQATGLTYGSYGGISVRDVGYWQGDDSWVTEGGYESCFYDSYLCYMMVQYYVSAGSLGYGYDKFIPD